MTAKRKATAIPLYEIAAGNKLKKTRKKVTVDHFTPIGRAAREKEAAEHAGDKAEAAALKRRYERAARKH